MRRIGTNIIFFVVMLSTLTLSSTAQQAGKCTVSLKINEDSEQFSGQLIASRKHAMDLSYSSPAREGLGQAPGGVLVRIEQVNDPPLAYKIWVDSDGDHNLDNDRPQVVLPNSSIIARVNRKWVNGRQQTLPYTIKYLRERDQDGQHREHFMWIPHYRAEGKLKNKSCEGLLVVLDLTGDGQFDSEDFFSGTSIGLDRNGDGRIWGKDEYLKGEQIIEYCGEAFLIDGVAVDGTNISLAITALRVPSVGAQLPAFWLTTLEGKRIDSKSLRHKVHMLDFWASWCKPCVEKFSLVKQLSEEFKDNLSIIAVNVDEEPRLPMARQIIKDYRLPWPHVMNGRGEADPVWKMFGAIDGNRLAIPLYVLVDDEGRLRYAGNGGEDLFDLQAEIKQLLKKTDKN
jgi:thiol-disulfide isomerase/thioredoxin